MADDFTFMTRVLLLVVLVVAVCATAVRAWWRAVVRWIKRRIKR